MLFHSHSDGIISFCRCQTCLFSHVAPLLLVVVACMIRATLSSFIVVIVVQQRTHQLSATFSSFMAESLLFHEEIEFLCYFA